MENDQRTRINPGFDGMDAKRGGLPAEACPYEPGPRRTAWIVGWHIAEKEDAPTVALPIPRRELAGQSGELVGRYDDMIIIGTAPRYILSHVSDGRISIRTPEGEAGWFDADEVAQAIGAFVRRRL